MLVNIHTHGAPQNDSVSTNPVLEVVDLGGWTGAQLPEHYSVAIHPQSIDEDWQSNFDRCIQLAKNRQCLMIGECGLDSHAAASDAMQEKVFCAHIELANQVGKPLIIHCVRRFGRCLHLLKMSRVPVIFHGFSRTEAVAGEILKHGHQLSFGPALLKKVSLQQTLSALSADAFWLETDGKPVSLAQMYAEAARLKGMDRHQLEALLETKFRNLFLPHG